MKDDRIFGPLTVEQLREMDGCSVQIGDAQGNIVEKALVNIDFSFAVGKSGVKYGFDLYGKTWLAYAYPPDHREPCELCRTFSGEVILQISKMNAYDQSKISRYVSALFCPRCGRPLWKNEFAGGSDKHETVDK